MVKHTQNSQKPFQTLTLQPQALNRSRRYGRPAATETVIPEVEQKGRPTVKAGGTPPRKLERK